MTSMSSNMPCMHSVIVIDFVIRVSNSLKYVISLNTYIVRKFSLYTDRRRLIFEARAISKTLQGKRKVYSTWLQAVNHACIAMCYIAIWLIRCVIIRCTADKKPEIDRFGEILIRIGFTQMVSQL